MRKCSLSENYSIHLLRGKSIRRTARLPFFILAVQKVQLPAAACALLEYHLRATPPPPSPTRNGKGIPTGVAPLINHRVPSVIAISTTVPRCGPYVGTTDDTVQCLTYQTEWNVQTCRKETKHTLFWGVRKKGFLYVVAKLRAKSQKPRKSLCPTVLKLRCVISTWWDENMTLFVFSACYEIHWDWFCGRKQTKKCKDRKEHFFREGCFDRKEYISNTAKYTLFMAGAPAPVFFVIFHQILHLALGDELYYSVWTLSDGKDMLPWPNFLSEWADGLGQVHCQYGTFAKLRTSCPCEVEFEVVLFFFEGDWYVHEIVIWECFDVRTWTRRIFFLLFGLLEHEANRIPDTSATFIGSCNKFCKRNRMAVCPARKQKPSILSVSCRLNRFNRCSRWRTTPPTNFVPKYGPHLVYPPP